MLRGRSNYLSYTFNITIIVAYCLQAANARSLLKDCPPGEIMLGDKCVCAVGYYYQHGASDGCLPCYNGWTTNWPNSPRCDACRPGYGGTECKPCPSGTYNPGRTGTNDCQACPVAKLTECAKGSQCDPAQGLVIDLHPDGTECSRGICKEGLCVCKPGFGGRTCRPCAAGTWSPGNSTAACRACPIVRLTECAKGSKCDPAEGLVIELKEDGTKCSRGVCKDGLCVSDQACPPGHGGPDCTPCLEGFYSPGGSTDECFPCPQPMPPPWPICIKSARCDPVKGFVVEYFPEGSDCLGGWGICTNTRCVCKPGHGGNGCSPCINWSYSPGGDNADCRPCPQALPPRYSCVEAYHCDPIKGFYTEFKREGDSCGGDGIGICKNQKCKCPAGSGGSDCTRCKSGTWSPGLNRGAKCRECPTQVLCKRAQLPCEMFPPCNRRTGQPTSTCWVPKPDDAKCTPDGTKTISQSNVTIECNSGQYKCYKGDCIPANRC